MANLYLKSRMRPLSSPVKKLVQAMMAISILVASGTVGLMFMEEMSFIDALYMVVITLSTVGFGEIQELHANSRIFVMFLIVFGVLLGGFVVTIVGQFILEGQFREIVTRRKMDKALGKLKNHFVVAGFGRVGRQVAEEFKKRKVPFVIIEKNKEALDQLVSEGFLFVEGDASADETLRQVGIEKARTLVSTLPDEALNVYLTLTARYMNSGLKIIARADFEEGEKKLMRAGADHVVLPHLIGGNRMAMASLRPNVVDFMQIAAVGENGLSLEEMIIPGSSDLIGQSLMKSGLKSDYGVTIIGIRHEGSEMTLNPEPTEVLLEGDVMILIGQVEQLERLNSSFGE